MTGARLAYGVVVFALAACDPAFTLQGRLVDSAGCGVAGAEVMLVCYSADQWSAISDAEGWFHASSIGAFGDACRLEVRRRGHSAVSYDLLPYCTKPYYRDTCTMVTLDVTLP